MRNTKREWEGNIGVETARWTEFSVRVPSGDLYRITPDVENEIGRKHSLQHAKLIELLPLLVAQYGYVYGDSLIERLAYSIELNGGPCQSAILCGFAKTIQEMRDFHSETTEEQAYPI